jgi:hypothetical protein
MAMARNAVSPREDWGEELGEGLEVSATIPLPDAAYVL